MKRPPTNAGFIILLAVIVLCMGLGAVLLVAGLVRYLAWGEPPVEGLVGVVLLGVGVTCCILSRIAARGG